MTHEPTIITEAETGCYLDSHRGHSILRDMVALTIKLGYIVGPFERFALDTYDDHNADQNYPHDAVAELADDALAWLNGEPERRQYAPPVIPADHAWDWNDGDFGLYPLRACEAWRAGRERQGRTH